MKKLVVPGRHGDNVNVGPGERMLSVFGAGVLISLALQRHDRHAAMLALPAGLLLWRGVSGHCPGYSALEINSAVEDYKGQRTRRVITINKPVQELYSFWRDFGNLPRFMQNLESVHAAADGTSTWRARGPAGRTVEWKAEITNDVANDLIEWRSLPGASVPNSGSVRFRSNAGSRGTVVEVTMEYQPPAGSLGEAVARIMGHSAGQQIDEDLRRFKQIMETGEVPTTEGQPSAHDRHSVLSALTSAVRRRDRDDKPVAAPPAVQSA
jgi:uncharacterized membrane protein